MKVEIISIGTELLQNDVIDVNAVRATTCLREIGTLLTCRVTVGDETDMIMQAIQSALQRADVILTMGGLGHDANDFTRLAILHLLHASPKETHIPGAKFLGMNEPGALGYQLNLDGKTVICLPGGRRRVAHLLENEVVPFLKMKQKQGVIYTGDVLLHTAGLVESDIRQRLEPLILTEAEQVMLHSFAGQTDIRLWVEANSPDKVKERLNILRTNLYYHLSDHIYGEGETRLEQVVLDTLRQRRLSLAIAECYTQHALYRLLAPFVSKAQAVSFLPVKNPTDINAMLDIPELNEDTELTRWTRKVGGLLRERVGTDLSLVVLNQVSAGGMQLMVTLASPKGISLIQRTFGGHPDNIGDWTVTLSLVLLRRWLMANPELSSASEFYNETPKTPAVTAQYFRAVAGLLTEPPQ